MLQVGRLENAEKPTPVTSEASRPAPALDSFAPAPSDRDKAVLKGLGLELSNLTEDDRKLFKIGDRVRGVLVASVAPNSPASEMRLVAGDVIAEVNQTPVGRPAEIGAQIEAMRQAGRTSTLHARCRTQRLAASSPFRWRRSRRPRSPTDGAIVAQAPRRPPSRAFRTAKGTIRCSGNTVSRWRASPTTRAGRSTSGTGSGASSWRGSGRIQSPRKGGSRATSSRKSVSSR